MPDDHEPTAFELQDQAYQVLNNYFDAHEDEVVEIEILPPALHPPNGGLLEDGLNVGVPKVALVSANLGARRLFLEQRNHDHEVTAALQATRVMILFDPEHLTAVNFRKRRLARLQHDLDANSAINYTKAINREFYFLNSILTSPLHRQSKSPTLWYHRVWLLDLALPIKARDASPDRFLTFLRGELDAVLKSGEQHPKNYYAWQYSRRLFFRVDELYHTDPHKPWKDAYNPFLVTSALLVKAWCFKHTGDISGWSFLLFLLPKLESIPRRRRIVKEVLDFAIRLKWKQDSVWSFIRTVLADDVLSTERDSLIQQLQDHHTEHFNTPNDTGIITDVSLAQAVKWIDKYKKQDIEGQPVQVPK